MEYWSDDKKKETIKKPIKQILTKKYSQLIHLEVYIIVLINILIQSKYS